MDIYVLVIIISLYVILLSFGIIFIRQDIDKVMKEIKYIKTLQLKDYYETAIDRGKSRSL